MSPTCNPATAGLYILTSRINSSKFALKPQTFHWIMDWSIILGQKQGWVLRISFAFPCSGFRLGWNMRPAGRGRSPLWHPPGTLHLYTGQRGSQWWHVTSSGSHFWGTNRTLKGCLERSAEPLEAAHYFQGSAEPLPLCELAITDLHSTLASVEASPDFPEDAWVLVHTSSSSNWILCPVNHTRSSQDSQTQVISKYTFLNSSHIYIYI